MAEKVLRLPKVVDRTGVPRASIYLKISQGLFPPPISLGERSVGWLESEIDEWINRQIELSRNLKEKK